MVTCCSSQSRSPSWEGPFVLLNTKYQYFRFLPGHRRGLTRAKCMEVPEGWAPSDSASRLPLKLTPFSRGISASLDEDCTRFPTLPHPAPPYSFFKAFLSRLWPEGARWRQCRPPHFHKDAQGVGVGHH